MGLFVQDFEIMDSPSVLQEENIINNVFEFVSEVILDHKNAMPEYGNNSANKDFQAQKHVIINLFTCQLTQENSNGKVQLQKTYAPFTENYAYQFCKEINPPPPKVLA